MNALLHRSRTPAAACEEAAAANEKSLCASVCVPILVSDNNLWQTQKKETKIF
jgi:hypothetical protein